MTAHYVDRKTGEIVTDAPESGKRPDLRVVGCRDCDRKQAEIEVLEGQVKDLERDMKGKRAAIRRLTNEREQERKAYVRREEVELWFTTWQLATNHPNSRLGPDRFDAIRKAIDLGYQIEQWELVCEFAGAFPYGPPWARKAHDKESERKDAPENDLVKRFEHYARLGWELKRR